MMDGQAVASKTVTQQHQSFLFLRAIRVVNQPGVIVQKNGKLPNLARMRVAAHQRTRRDHAEFRQGTDFGGLFDEAFDRLYASTIFERSRRLAQEALCAYPGAFIGGTGWPAKPVEFALGWM